MISVFLVEDEFIVREGIKNINWEAHGLSFVGEASDGELAFPLIKKKHPDIVITDICMPFMDGLELSRLIKKELPQTKILILSGHEEFEYAKDAIQIGVEEYLLKPINSDELLQVVRRAADKITEERQAGRRDREDEAGEKERREHAKSLFFSNLIEGRLSMAELLEKARSIGIELAASYYQIMLVKIGRSTFDSYSAAVNEMNDKLQNYISSKSEHMVCFDREPEGEIILFMEESKEKMEEDVQDLADFLENMLSEKPEIGYFGSVGSPVSRIREISQAYETAAHAFAYRFLVEGNQILRFEQIDRKPVLMERADGEYHVGKINFGGLDKTRIEAFLRGGDSEEIPIFVEEYLENAGDACQNSLIFRQYLVMDMYVAASHFLEQLGDSEEFSRKEPFESPAQMEQVLQQLDTTISYVISLFREVMEIRDCHTKEHNSDIVELAKKYIDENYSDEDLSLNTVAAEVNVSPNHLSAIFSQKTGHTFIRYLTDVRMNRAKELLKCTTMRSSEISEKVGYKDPHYFSHLFKKNQGCTPTQYREEGAKG